MAFPGYRVVTLQSVLDRAGIRVESSASIVTVRIPNGVTVTYPLGRAINHRYMAETRDSDPSGALTIVEPGGTMTSRGLQQLEEGVVGGQPLGIDRWALVCPEPELSDRINSHIVGVEYRAFEDEAPARDWLTRT